MSPRAARRGRALARLQHRAGVRLTVHARERAGEHGASEDEVLLVVAAPEQTYTCPEYRYGPDRRMYQRGRLAVVVDERQQVVVTVLPRVQEEWTHRACKGRTTAPRVGAML